MLCKAPVVAIDGPAGAGKSTVAKILAEELGLRYLDTGAMYRALALKLIRLNLDPTNGDQCAAILVSTSINFGSDQSVVLDDVPVSDLIRTPEVGEAASALSTHGAVRAWLVDRQRAIVEAGGVILEGRDATTVVAPEADLKIYLTASLEERARRRLQEFRKDGLANEFEEVRTQIENRDHRDITRAESPLKVAPDAKVVETGARSVREIVDQIKLLFHEVSQRGE